VGPRFQGVKMLPPGPHFLCYSVPGSQRHGGGMGPLTGFFFDVAAGAAEGQGAAGTVVVRRYDAAVELLRPLEPEEVGPRARPAVHTRPMPHAGINAP
jgi:A1 cistron-splicing factor AAR2